MSFWSVKDYSIEDALRDTPRYGGKVFADDDCVMKYHGGYVEMNIDADNDKGHVSYDLRFDSNGNLSSWDKHNG